MVTGQRESQIVLIDPKMGPQMVMGQRESQIAHHDPKWRRGRGTPNSASRP